MGCYVRVSLPPLTEGGIWEPVGQELKLSYRVLQYLEPLGVPLTDDQGMFSHEDITEITRVRDRLLEERNEVQRLLDTCHEDDAELSPECHWSALEAADVFADWLQLYDMVVVLRQRGVEARLFGA